MKKIFMLFLSSFVLIFVSLNIISCSESTQAKDVSNYSETDDYSVKTLFISEKSGELIDGFTYEINDELKTITINGSGKLESVRRGKSIGFLVDWITNIDIDYNYDYALIISDGITEIDCGYDILPHFCSKIYLGKDVKNIDTFLSEGSGRFEVHPKNPHLTVYNDCLYTKDFKKLLRYSRIKAANDFHPNLEEIGNYAFANYFFLDGNPLIIPWGVTKIGNLFLDDARDGYYVIPDTVINTSAPVPIPTVNSFTSYFPYWIPSRNNPTLWKKWHSALTQRYHHLMTETEYGTKWLGDYGECKITDIPADNIAKYYGIKPNSLKTFQNGKTYYFDNNYKMAKGWTKVKNTWYYFNDYGAAVVKIWLKSGGKWYYMQEDGTMATNKWIKWYNKWYYVGKDGAMYANRKTPDGYYVNASGVWVK